MANLIRVKKSLGKINPLKKIERNSNVSANLTAYPQTTPPPYTPTVYNGQIDEAQKQYTQHLKGDHEATINMETALSVLATYYYDTAVWIEKLANDANDPALPVKMGFELYKEPKPRAPKKITAQDGATAGDIIVECLKKDKATGYVVKIAEIFEGKIPIFEFGGACSTTTVTLRGFKPDTKYHLVVSGVFSTSECEFSAPISFRTKENVEE